LNPYIHSEISVKKRGGIIEDYYKIHAFMDCTKDICSDNRHRLLHTMWGINQVVVPIFGVMIKNSDGKMVNVKDLCEQDHVLPDYRNRFIPTLSDFVEAIDENPLQDTNWKQKVEIMHQHYAQNPAIQQLLLSPLSHTGKLISLLITHNSWFFNTILPKIFPTQPVLRDFEIAPSLFFNQMNFELWMDNGADIPKSARKLNQKSF
jgi:hypothetical protein